MDINKSKKIKLKLASLSYIVFIVIMITLIILITTIIRPGRVEGLSMFPTLKNGQFISINTSINKNNIKAGDIIVYTSPENKKVVKRVVAINSHKIKVVDGILYIDNKKTDYSFAKGNKDEVKINDGEFFAMGDNQLNSRDSFNYGGVKIKNIIGKLNSKHHKEIKIYK